MNTPLKPKVGIGLPVYNGERFLKNALDSILAQTFTDFELIIVDNASTDGTEGICREYAERDSRIRYHRNGENIGLVGNFRRAFELSRGDYFRWACADDMCKPTLLAECADVLNHAPSVVLVYAKAEFIDENEHRLDIDDPGWDLRSECPHERMRYVIDSNHWVNSLYGLMRASALRRTGLIADYHGGDHTLLCELSLLGKFQEIPLYLFQRRIHSRASIHHKNDAIFFLGREGYACIPFVKRYRDFAVSILRSSLKMSQKLSLLAHLSRRIYWNRQVLMEEVKFVSKVFLARKQS